MKFRFGAALLLIGLLNGCGGKPPPAPAPPPPPPPPPVLEMSVTGGTQQNPDAGAMAQPVAVHVYQLAGTQKFADADVYALIDHEQATLGADDLGSTEFVLKPSEKRDFTEDLKPGTTAIGVVAWFRDIDNAQWRASAAVAAHGTSKLVLEVQKLSVSLKPAAK